MKFLAPLFLFISWCFIAFPKDSSGQFELDRDLVEKMYRASVETSTERSQETVNGVLLEPTFSLVSFSEFVLNNRYFTIPYSQEAGTFPLFQIAAEIPLMGFSGFALGSQFKLGYGYKEGLYKVDSPSGNELKDVIRLHWLPATASLKLSYRNFPLIVPTLSVGAGVQLLYQSGRLDGSTQNFLVPFVSVSPAIRLWDLTLTRPHWFGGVILGSTWANSIGSNQLVRYWSLDVGTSFVF